MNKDIIKLIADSKIWIKRRSPEKAIEVLNKAQTFLQENDNYLEDYLSNKIADLQNWVSKVKDEEQYVCGTCRAKFDYAPYYYDNKILCEECAIEIGEICENCGCEIEGEANFYDGAIACCDECYLELIYMAEQTAEDEYEPETEGS
jgi:predicted  nucleic acid-binding Zn ribbon protein